MRFIITGLPRSGHAWLANYLYKGGSVVTHEGARFSVQEGASLRQAHIRALQTLTGDCSSTWLLFPDLLRLVPRVVLIDRPVDDSMRSFERATEGLPTRRQELYATLAAGYRAALQLHPLIIPYEETYEVQTIERICHHVREDFDVTRLALLRNTRVTQDVHREYRLLAQD
jgi:hypothetical protein